MPFSIYEILDRVIVLVWLARAMFLTRMHFLSINFVSCSHGFGFVTRWEMLG